MEGLGGGYGCRPPQHKEGNITVRLTGDRNPAKRPEVREKIRLARLGKKRKPFSDEWKRNLSKALKGKMVGEKNPMWKKDFTEEHRRRISKANMGEGNGMWGRKHTEETKEKIRQTRLGKKLSAKTKAKLSQRLRGNGNPRWKNGLTETAGRIRNSYKYKEWRQAIFMRDDFTCQECGKHGGDLHVHHIKLFKDLLKEVAEHLPLFDLYSGALLYSPLWKKENGMTLCKKCHKKYLLKKEV